VHGSVREKDEGRKSQQIGKKTNNRPAKSIRSKAKAGVLKLTSGTSADLGPLRGTVELVATNAVENDTAALGIDQFPVADVIVDPKPEDQNNGADRVKQRPHAEIDG